MLMSDNKDALREGRMVEARVRGVTVRTLANQQTTQHNPGMDVANVCCHQAASVRQHECRCIP